MTVVAACVDEDGGVVMAADSLVVASEGNRSWRDEKVVRLSTRDTSGGWGEWLAAPCGSSVLLGLLRHRLDPPKLPVPGGRFGATPADEERRAAEHERLLDRWALDVCEALDGLALARGLADDANDKRPDGVEVLVGYDGRLWNVGTSQALRLTRGYCAVGSGGDVAVGAMHALLTRGGYADARPVPAELALEAVHAAVAAACEHDASCAPPIVVHRLEPRVPARRRRTA